MFYYGSVLWGQLPNYETEREASLESAGCQAGFCWLGDKQGEAIFLAFRSQRGAEDL